MDSAVNPSRTINRTSRAARPDGLSRVNAVKLIRAELEDGSWPRLQMALIVAFAGLVGLLASFAMLQLGLRSMEVRYPLALVFAYAAFLFMLWLWLRVTRGYDAPDLSLLDPAVGPHDGSAGSSQATACEPTPQWSSGGGGDFAGGGATESFDAAGAVPLDAPLGLDVVAEAIGGADEAAVPLALVAAVTAIVAMLAFASLYVVWTAPVLFAELIFDGALSYGLYRRIRATERRHWFNTALRMTFLPFVLTALLFWGAGWAMQAYVPKAASVGEVLRAVKTGDR